MVSNAGPEVEIETAWYDEAKKRVEAYEKGQADVMSLEKAIEEVSRAYQGLKAGDPTIDWAGRVE